MKLSPTSALWCGAALTTILIGCGAQEPDPGPPPELEPQAVTAGQTRDSDMRDVSGERDAVESDGTIQLTGSGRSTCNYLVAEGRSATVDDIDPAGLAAGLRTVAGLCESAGINITWYA